MQAYKAQYLCFVKYQPQQLSRPNSSAFSVDSLCINLTLWSGFFFFLKWLHKLADLICGKISQHYFMFTETAVSTQWLEVAQCAWCTKGDTDAYIYFHWQWTQDNALGKKIEKRK